MSIHCFYVTANYRSESLQEFCVVHIIILLHTNSVVNLGQCDLQAI
jgi:hypothetical protein